MTTILKALEELQRRGATGAQHPDAWTDPKRQPRWTLIAVGLLMLIGSAAGFVFFLSTRDTAQRGALQTSSTPQTAITPNPPPAVPAQPAPVPPIRAAPAADERPWALVGNKKVEGSHSAPGTSVPPSDNERAAETREGSRSQLRINPPLPKGEVARPPGKTKLSIAGRSPAVGLDEPHAGNAPGNGPVQVKSIAYSPVPAQRMVTLRIGNGNVVTLHEGDSVSGVEVQLILADSVYLRRGGNVFAVGRTP